MFAKSEIIQKGWSFGGSELKCRCGGNLLCIDHIYGEYVCDHCELVWRRCGACNGDLHAYDAQGEIVHHALS